MAKFLWDELTNVEQKKYIDQAENLIDPEYVDSSTDVNVLAKKIYESIK